MRFAKALMTLLALASLAACIVVPFPRHGGYGYDHGGGGRGEVIIVNRSRGGR